MCFVVLYIHTVCIQNWELTKTDVTTDMDECVESAMSGSSACPEGRICRNTIGSFSCDCPEGTMLNSEGECEGKLKMLHLYR